MAVSGTHETRLERICNWAQLSRGWQSEQHPENVLKKRKKNEEKPLNCILIIRHQIALPALVRILLE